MQVEVDGQATPVSATDSSCWGVQVVPPFAVEATVAPPTATHDVGDEQAMAVSGPGICTFCCDHDVPPLVEARIMADLKALSPTA